MKIYSGSKVKSQKKYIISLSEKEKVEKEKKDLEEIAGSVRRKLDP